MLGEASSSMTATAKLLLLLELSVPLARRDRAGSTVCVQRGGQAEHERRRGEAGGLCQDSLGRIRTLRAAGPLGRWAAGPLLASCCTLIT
jgi:putative hemolysin